MRSRCRHAPSLHSRRLPVALLDEYTDYVDRAADEIGTIFDHLRQVNIRGLVAERLNDADYSQRSQPRRRTKRATPT